MHIVSVDFQSFFFFFKSKINFTFLYFSRKRIVSWFDIVLRCTCVRDNVYNRHVFVAIAMVLLLLFCGVLFNSQIEVFSHFTAQITNRHTNIHSNHRYLINQAKQMFFFFFFLSNQMLFIFLWMNWCLLEFSIHDNTHYFVVNSKCERTKNCTTKQNERKRKCAHQWNYVCCC